MLVLMLILMIYALYCRYKEDPVGIYKYICRYIINAANETTMPYEGQNGPETVDSSSSSSSSSTVSTTPVVAPVIPYSVKDVLDVFSHCFQTDTDFYFKNSQFDTIFNHKTSKRAVNAPGTLLNKPMKAIDTNSNLKINSKLNKKQGKDVYSQTHLLHCLRIV